MPNLKKNDPIAAALTGAVRIRDANAGDLDSVLALLNENDLPVDGVSEFFGPAYAVAEERNQILGAAGVELFGETGLFRSAVVHESARGRGIGESLTRDRIDWARGQEVIDLYLLTTTTENYFPRFGFERVNREKVPPAIAATREFTTLCPSSALVMRLTLR
jgi:amino-acid N-acetyltransferase